jgi:site-specific recombinase XerD
MPIEPLYEESLTHLSVEHNGSPLTVDAYRSDGRIFLRYLQEHETAPEVEAITKPVLRDYVIWLRKRGLQPATVARRIHSLRSFWDYLWENEYTDANPFRRVTLPKQPRWLPVYLSEDECRHGGGSELQDQESYGRQRRAPHACRHLNAGPSVRRGIGDRQRLSQDRSQKALVYPLRNRLAVVGDRSSRADRRRSSREQ